METGAYGAGSHRPRRAPGDAFRFRRVLVVEDEARLRRIIALSLASRGHEVREVGTAADAVRAAVDERPELMLLDLNLPDQSGWDVLRDLRDSGVEVPTVVVSAVRVVPSRLEEFRPLAYLPKPFPLEALLRLVREGARPEPAPAGGGHRGRAGTEGSEV